MNSARELLLYQSVDHLLSARWVVQAAFDDPPTEVGRQDGLEFGYAYFGAVAELLKRCLDLGDERTFLELERKWAQSFDDVWLPRFPSVTVTDAWSERNHGPADPLLLELLRRREVQRLGLTMWTAHLLSRPQPPERQAVLTGAFGRLASRFSGLEWTLDAFDAAQDDDHHADAMPWTSWFLAELPDEEAHFIPTDSKLLFVTLLLCARFIEPERPASLTPRAWFVWRDADIRTVLEQLKAERARWQPVLGVPDSFVHSDELSADPELGWRQRIDRLAKLLELGRRAQQEDERGRVRTTALDPERIQDLRRETLREAVVSRVLRDTMAVQGRIVRLNDRPEDHEGLVSHNWAPRSFFTIDSQVVGLDLMARDLAQPTRVAEQQQLIAALSEATPAGAQEGDLQSSLARVIDEMRDDGMKPSLIVLPLNWRLQRELRLDRQDALPVDHPLVPPAHRRTFCGVYDNVPALDLARVSKDRFWVLDLTQAIRFEEWPSDEDSGLRFELRSFDDELSAASFLADHPEAAAPEKTREEALLEIRDRVLISLRLCWRILSGEPQAARSVAIPADLQRHD